MKYSFSLGCNIFNFLTFMNFFICPATFYSHAHLYMSPNIKCIVILIDKIGTFLVDFWM